MNRRRFLSTGGGAAALAFVPGLARAAAPLAKCMSANAAQMVTIGLYGGGVLVGHP